MTVDYCAMGCIWTSFDAVLSSVNTFSSFCSIYRGLADWFFDDFFDVLIWDEQESGCQNHNITEPTNKVFGISAKEHEKNI
jgi:hypothetical protein